KLIAEFPDWDKNKIEKIVLKQVEKGMTKEEVYLSLGRPSRTRKMQDVEEWEYDNLNKVLKFKNSILVEEKKME
ncbi:MAG: outer membrane protein assembly factor BamE, partial [candidate division WOR-3 bacterium]